jgi:hypothetical protein
LLPYTPNGKGFPLILSLNKYCISFSLTNKIVAGESLGAATAVIVVATRVRVSGVVAVRHTGVRGTIVPIAAAETAKQHLLRRCAYQDNPSCPDNQTHPAEIFSNISTRRYKPSFLPGIKDAKEKETASGLPPLLISRS